MKKALTVGINHYRHVGSLFGCVDDAHNVRSVLERHGDSTINFDVKMLTGTGPSDEVDRGTLRAAIEDLFSGEVDTALIYFAGHGFVDATGGFLLTSESKTGDDGIALHDIMAFANKSPARNKIIILDSCHSGVVGKHNASSNSELSDGMTILTASTEEQYATEENGGGIFTNLLVDAMNGAAANLVGEITPGSVYAHIDQSLGSWDQRPVFKTNVKSFVSLRRVSPPISLHDLQRLSTLFPSPGFEFQLEPSFEPESENPNPQNTEIFAVLQRYNRVNILVPVGVTHMYHAAMESKSCKLTALGEHYRRLVARNRI